MKYSGNIDKECVELCDAINSIPGIYTVESCCGHGKHEFRIWFKVEDHENLPILLYYIDPCHVGFRWHCEVITDCAMSPITYKLYSESLGKKSYQEADEIAKKINDFLQSDESKKL